MIAGHPRKSGLASALTQISQADVGGLLCHVRSTRARAAASRRRHGCRRACPTVRAVGRAANTDSRPGGQLGTLVFSEARPPASSNSPHIFPVLAGACLCCLGTSVRVLTSLLARKAY